MAKPDILHSCFARNVVDLGLTLENSQVSILCQALIDPRCKCITLKLDKALISLKSEAREQLWNAIANNTTIKHLIARSNKLIGTFSFTPRFERESCMRRRRGPHIQYAQYK